MRVVVIRSGGTWFGDGGGKPSGLQSQDNHTAVARAIAAGGHDVLCVGRILGDVAGRIRASARDAAVTQLCWAITPSLGIAPNLEHLRGVCLAIEAWRPDALVNVTGSEITTLSPVVAAARGITTIDAGWRYGWPLVEVLDALRLPRICVVTDCRCYPRESELTLGDHFLPAAVLSQEDRDQEKKVLDRRFKIRARYAGIERLRLAGVPRRRPAPAKMLQQACCALAHSHMDEARIEKHKRELWRWISAEGAPPVHAYGDGWRDFDSATLTAMGEVPHADIYDVLGRYPCGPLVPMAHGWVSPKYREYALAGCVPLPYGRGEDLLTYDWSPRRQDGHCVPLGASTRFSSPHELRELYHRALEDQQWREEQIELALQRSEPDAAELLACVEHYGRRRERTPEALERWGGYADA